MNDTYVGTLVSDAYLEHHGILGQKWGVRRYQNSDGSLTDAGRKRYGSLIKSVFTSYRKRRRLAKALKKRQATLDAKKEAAEKARAHEEEKRKAIESGDPVRISAFQNELSNEELRAATDRVRLTETLKAQKEDTIQTGLDKAEAIMARATRVKNLAEQGIGAWNTAAKIHNSFVEDDDEKWPVVDGVGKKADRKAIRKVIETGDPEQIAKLKGKLTVGETTDAVKSINNWKNIEANAAQNASNRAEVASKAEEAKKAAEKAQTDKFERYYQQKAKSDASRDADVERERMDRAFDAGRKYYEKYTSTSSKSENSTRKLLTTASDLNDRDVEKAAESGVKYWMTVVNGGGTYPGSSSESASNYYKDRAAENKRYNEWETRQQKSSASSMIKAFGNAAADKAARDAEQKRSDREYEIDRMAARLKQAREARDDASKSYQSSTPNIPGMTYKATANEVKALSKAVDDIYDEIREKGYDYDEIRKRIK